MPTPGIIVPETYEQYLENSASLDGPLMADAPPPSPPPRQPRFTHQTARAVIIITVVTLLLFAAGTIILLKLDHRQASIGAKAAPLSGQKAPADAKATVTPNGSIADSIFNVNGSLTVVHQSDLQDVLVAGLTRLQGGLDVTGTATFGGTLNANRLNGDGSGLTNLGASNLSTGTLNDARLSANVPLLNVDNNFSGVNNFNSLNANRITQNGHAICDISGNCNAGAGNGKGTLQTAYAAGNGGATPDITLQAGLGGLDIQDASTSINASLFAVRSGNASGLGNALLGINSTGQVSLQNNTDSSAAFRLQTSAGSALLTADTLNQQVSVVGGNSTTNYNRGTSFAYGYGNNYNFSDVIQTSDGGYAAVNSQPTAVSSIVKLDAAGKVSWTASLGQAGQVTALSTIIQTNDDGYLVAGYQSPDEHSFIHPFVAAFSSAGNLLWSKTYTVTNRDYFVNGVTLVPTASGRYLLQGLDNNSQSTYVLTLSGSGMLLATQQLSDDQHGGLKIITLLATSDGGYLAMGYNSDYLSVVFKFTDDGAISWSKVFPSSSDITSVIQTSDGGYVLSGAVTDGNGGAVNGGLLLKFTESGSLSWSKLTPSVSSYGTLLPTANNGFIVSNQTDNSGGVERFDGSGTPLSSTNLAIVEPTDLISTADGGLLISGTSGQHTSQPDVLVKLNAANGVTYCSPADCSSAAPFASSDFDPGLTDYPSLSLADVTGVSTDLITPSTSLSSVGMPVATYAYYDDGRAVTSTAALRVVGPASFSGGFVGIGTATPQYQLDVAGDARVTGNLQIDGNANLAGTVSTGTLAVNGDALVAVTTDSSHSLVVQDAAGQAVLSVDSLNHTLVIYNSSNNQAYSVTIDLSNDFTDPNSWNCGPGWTVHDGYAVHTPGNSYDTCSVTADLGVTQDTVYDIYYEMGDNVGTGVGEMYVRLGDQGGISGDPASQGYSEDYVRTGSSATLVFTASPDFDGDISNIQLSKLMPAASLLTTTTNEGATLEVRAFAGSAYIGTDSGDYSSAPYNTALGSESLANDISGSSNTAIGYQTLNQNMSGERNTVLGAFALSSNLSGSGNVAIGSTDGGYYSVLRNNQFGNNNTAVGNGALGAASGSNNSALGYDAGACDLGSRYCTQFVQNATAIGAYAQVQEDNAIVLGSVDNPTMVGIGTTIPLNTFSVSPAQLNDPNDYISKAGGSNIITDTNGAFTPNMVGDTLILAQSNQIETITGYIDAHNLMTSLISNSGYSGVTFRLHYVGLQVTSQGRVGVGVNPSDTSNTLGPAQFSVRASDPGSIAVLVQGASGQSADLLNILDGQGNKVLAVTSSGVYARLLTVTGHLTTQLTGSQATVVAGADAGNAATVSIAGDDTAGTVTITTGSGATSGAMAAVTFDTVYVSNRVIVVLTPNNASGATVQYWYDTVMNSDGQTTGFTIHVANAPAASTTYGYSYQVIGLSL